RSRGSFASAAVSVVSTSGAWAVAVTACSFSFFSVLTGSIPPRERHRRSRRPGLRNGCHHGRTRPRRSRPSWHARQQARRPCGRERSCRRRARGGLPPSSTPTQWCDPCCRRRAERTRGGSSASPRDADAPACRQSSCGVERAGAPWRPTSTFLWFREPWLLTSLSGLAANNLARVAHTLALVRLGLSELADVGCHFAD